MYASAEDRLDYSDSSEYWNDLELAYDQAVEKSEIEYFTPYSLVDLWEQLGAGKERGSKLGQESTLEWLASFAKTPEGKLLVNAANAYLTEQFENNIPNRKNLQIILQELGTYKINTKDIFEQRLIQYFVETPEDFYRGGVKILNGKLDARTYLQTMDKYPYPLDGIDPNLMLVKHYCRNGDKFRGHPDSVHLYTAPGEVNRYIFDGQQAVNINRKIMLGFSFIDGIENDNPQQFFVNGNEVTINEFAIKLENEYNTKKYNIFSSKKNQKVGQKQYYIGRLRLLLKNKIRDYPNELPLLSTQELEQLRNIS